METLIAIKYWLLINADKIPVILNNTLAIAIALLLIETAIRGFILLFGLVANQTKTNKDNLIYSAILKSWWYNTLKRAMGWTVALCLKLIRRRVS